MRKPDFVGIGAPRTGTTWLFEMLKSHPEIQIPSKKALNFFNEHFDRGESWYFEQFDSFKEKVVGEISPLYFGHSHLAERLFNSVPQTKLILIVREPVERLKSHVKLINTLREKNASVEERVKELPLLLEHGLYFKHIQEILKYFSEDQLLILSNKEIGTNPKMVYGKVVEFLNVDTAIIPSRLREKVGFNITPKYKILERMRKSVHGFLTRNGMANVIWFLKRKGLSAMLRRFNSFNENSSTQKEANVEDLSGYHSFYEEDLSQFEKKFSIKLKSS